MSSSEWGGALDLGGLEYHLRQWPGKASPVAVKAPDGTLLDPVYVDFIDGRIVIITEPHEEALDAQ